MVWEEWVYGDVGSLPRVYVQYYPLVGIEDIYQKCNCHLHHKLMNYNMAIKTTATNQHIKIAPVSAGHQSSFFLIHSQKIIVSSNE